MPLGTVFANPVTYACRELEIFTLSYIGAELVLRHIRNGVELDPIDLNRNYDFDYQQINYIPEVQIFPVSSYLNCCYYMISN